MCSPSARKTKDLEDPTCNFIAYVTLKEGVLYLGGAYKVAEVYKRKSKVIVWRVGDVKRDKSVCAEPSFFLSPIKLLHPF